MIIGLIACVATVGTLPVADDSASSDSTVPDVDDSGVEQIPGVESVMPVLVIDTEGDFGSDKIEGTLQVIEVHGGDPEDLEDVPRSLESDIGIEIHGSSSRGYPKLGYRMETRDADGDDEDHSLLGLKSGSDWVLHAPYSDKTLVRNAFAYSLANRISEAWHPGTRFVELVLNGDYRGVYVLVERIRRGRIGGSDPDLDATGAYVVRIDQHRNEGWDTARGTPIDWYQPRYEDMTSTQDTYLRGWFESFEDAMAAEDFAATYPDWIETEEWIEHFLVNELTHNIDAYRLSAYLYKDGDEDGGKLHAGPVWDFDRAFGNVNYCDCWYAEGWIIDSLIDCGEGWQFPFWWRRLEEDPVYRERVACRWEELRGDAFSDSELDAEVQRLVAEIGDAEERDHEQWDILGEYIDPNYYVGESYEDEVDWLTEWTQARAEWMDTQLVCE